MLINVGINANGTASNDKFKFSGKTTHSNDTILINVDQERKLTAGDEITVFTGTGTQSGDYIIKTVAPNHATLKWDDSRLLSEGILVVAEATSINTVITDDTLVDVYSTDGKLLRNDVAYGKALDGLATGVYVVNGHKVVKR